MREAEEKRRAESKKVFRIMVTSPAGLYIRQQQQWGRIYTA
jgi:hypothetical protein